jgi:hypothetical protein
MAMIPEISRNGSKKSDWLTATMTTNHDPSSVLEVLFHSFDERTISIQHATQGL